MTTPFTAALRTARDALGAAPVEPGEAAVARRLARELGEMLARLEGREQPKDLVSIVCHDLKDPLASIVMGAGFLRKSAAAEEPGARRVIEAVARSAERMTQVVSDFHDLAKLEAGTFAIDPQPCDVSAAVGAAVATFEAQARDKKIELSFQAAAEQVTGRCDRARLVQIVGKLLANALKFTPSGGRVVVQVAPRGDRVLVSVADTGRGIPADRVASIFDYAANARRTPRDGPGLGLSIARSLVELQGGEISIESQVGGGTVFAFTLPRA